jgi:hypothetical protein
MYPGANYPNREHLSGLTSEDVAFAQRILPLERQIRHVKVASFSTLVPALKEAFEDLKRQRRSAELEQGVVAEAERHAKNALDKAAAARQVRPAPAPAPAPAVVPEPAPTPTTAGPREAVLTSAVSTVLGMLADYLRPMIAELIEQALNAPPAAVPPAPETAQAAMPTPTPATVAKPRGRRIRIGIVGNRNSYASDLQRDFPTVDFTCIDSLKCVDSIKNCERVLVLTKFISHKLDGQVKRSIEPTRYTPVHGCLTDIRRVITGLLNGERTEASQPVVALAA